MLPFELIVDVISHNFELVLCGFLAFGLAVFWSSTPAGGVPLASLFLVVNNGLHPQKLELPAQGIVSSSLGAKTIPGSVFGIEYHSVLAAK